jgi:plastocyanin
MKNHLFLSLAAALLPPAVGFAQASVEGAVNLPKTYNAPVANERYQIVSEAGVLKTDPPRAVIYLEGNFPSPANLPVKEMGQKDLTFLPSLLPVERGTKVEFPNHDNVYHNIFSYSPAKRFDLGRYPPDEKPTPSVTFDRAGLVTIRCDIHEHMRALILVLDTPHFAISDAQGHYRLTNLPAGHYLLKAWVNSKVTRQQPVELRSGGTLHVDFP